MNRIGLVFAVLMSLSLLFGGVAGASPADAVSVAVANQFFDVDGQVAARVTVLNTDSQPVSLVVSDSYGNRYSFIGVQSGDSVVAVMMTHMNVVMGYTVGVNAVSNDGRVTARGHGYGTYDLRPALPPSAAQYPVRVCEGPNYDFGKCLQQIVSPRGF